MLANENVSALDKKFDPRLLAGDFVLVYTIERMLCVCVCVCVTVRVTVCVTVSVCVCVCDSVCVVPT